MMGCALSPGFDELEFPMKCPVASRCLSMNSRKRRDEINNDGCYESIRRSITMQ
jgi:hypothetical protein